MHKLKITYSDVFVVLTVFIFLLIKLSTLSVHFGDGNVYIFAANQLLEGKMPYRDFFIVTPPFLIYFLSLFAIFFHSHLLLYSLIPIFYEAFSAIFIYLILRKFKSPLCWLGPFVYLFSFTILSTTDYLSGVAIVNLLVSLGFFALIKNKYWLSGIIFGLALMTKFYALPIIMGIVIYLIIIRSRHLISFSLSVVLTTLFVLLPYLIFSSDQLIKDLITHQLNRTGGIPKTDVLTYFFNKEIVIIIAAFTAIFLKDRLKYLFLLPLFGLSLFFLFFSDVYYLYLASLLPFLCFLTVLTLSKLWELSREYHQIVSIFFGLFFIFTIYQISDYLSHTAPLGHFDNSAEISQYIQRLPMPYPLYGSHDVTPAVALISGRPIFENLIETNPQGFRSHANDLQAVSSRATRNGIYLIARTINHSEIHSDQIGYEGYFSKEVFDQSCHKLKDFPSLEIEVYNQITVYNCKD